MSERDDGSVNSAGGGTSGLCDTHLHVYGPADRFPAPGVGLERDATLEDYLALRARLGITRAVYVQPSAYGRDHACLLDALERDPVEARAIGVLGTEATAAELKRFDAAGMRGVRFHDLAPGCLPMADLESVARHVAPLGWHVVVQVASADLPDYEKRLAALPCDVVIDHMGLMPAGAGVDHPGFRALLRLLDCGRCWVKLSAPYQVGPDGAPSPIDARARVGAMIGAAPDRLIWGSNWPHPRFAPGRKPDDTTLLATIREWCGAAWPRVAADNAARFYGFAAMAG